MADDTDTRDSAPVVDLTDRRAAENGRQTAENGRRDRRGRFQPGHGGGPGRPKGSRSATSLLAAARRFEQLASEQLDEIVGAVIDAARGGDMQAARLILDRISPARRGRHVEIELPEIRSADDLGRAQQAVLDAVAEGRLALDDAAALDGLLDSRRQHLETEDLAQRLARLERLHGDDA